jgi:hypothetical protein
MEIIAENQKKNKTKYKKFRHLLIALAWVFLNFPETAFYQVNAAIGETGSNLGVFRMERDIFMHKPDLLFVEFAGIDWYPANVMIVGELVN